MFNVYYGKAKKGDELNYFLDEPLETYEDVEYFIKEFVAEMWEDHPTMEDEYTFEQYGALAEDVMLLFESCEWFHGTDEQKQKIINICEDERFSLDDVILSIWMCSSAEYKEVASELEERGWN